MPEGNSSNYNFKKFYIEDHIPLPRLQQYTFCYWGNLSDTLCKQMGEWVTRGKYYRSKFHQTMTKKNCDKWWKIVFMAVHLMSPATIYLQFEPLLLSLTSIVWVIKRLAGQIMSNNKDYTKYIESYKLKKSSYIQNFLSVCLLEALGESMKIILFNWLLFQIPPNNDKKNCDKWWKMWIHGSTIFVSDNYIFAIWTYFNNH